MEKLKDITGKQFPKEQLYKGSYIRKEIAEFIKKEFPSIDNFSKKWDQM